MLIPTSAHAERSLLAQSTAGIGAAPLRRRMYRLLVLCQRSCGGADYHFPPADEGLLVNEPEQLVRMFGAELEHTASLLESIPLRVLNFVGLGIPSHPVHGMMMSRSRTGHSAASTQAQRQEQQRERVHPSIPNALMIDLYYR